MLVDTLAWATLMGNTGSTAVGSGASACASNLVGMVTPVSCGNSTIYIVGELKIAFVLIQHRYMEVDD